MIELQIKSVEREELIDITRQIQEIICNQGWQNGACHIYCPHTTCGLTINEGADPDVRRDLVSFFKEIAPFNHGWRHVEGNSDAHIRSTILGVSLLIPLTGGRLCLGQWQAIYLYEGDGPRTRSLFIQLLKS